MRYIGYPAVGRSQSSTGKDGYRVKISCAECGQPTWVQPANLEDGVVVVCWPCADPTFGTAPPAREPVLSTTAFNRRLRKALEL